jgi:hypothetical protein
LSIQMLSTARRQTTLIYASFSESYLIQARLTYTVLIVQRWDFSKRMFLLRFVKAYLRG